MAKKRASRAKVYRKPEQCQWSTCTAQQAVRANGMALSYCSKHNSEAASNIWKERKASIEEGTRRLASNGYWQVMHQGYWQWEHHVIAEQYLGRALADNESVVHLGLASNNAVESLGIKTVMPLVSYQTAGQ